MSHTVIAIKKMRIINLLVIPLLFLVACNEPINNDFLGFWKQENKNNYFLVKDNGGQLIVETYFSRVLDSTLEKTDFPAITDKESITISTHNGDAKGILTENKKVILMANKNTYKRIDDAIALAEIKAIMDAQQAENQLCFDLKQELTKNKAILLKNPEDACDNNWINFLKDFNSKTPSNCKIKGAEEGFPCL